MKTIDKIVEKYLEKKGYVAVKEECVSALRQTCNKTCCCGFDFEEQLDHCILCKIDLTSIRLE